MSVRDQADLLHREMSRAADALIEHADSVQIIATVHGADGTIMLPYGRGDWYARRGAVRDWLVRHDEQERCEARRQDDDD